MTKLGVSLYPEQETLEEMKQYMETAGKHGFTSVFTSMFSVPGSKEEVMAYFKKLCDIAHTNGMEVCADVNAAMFEKFGANESDLRVFKEIGIDELRMDFCFGDQRDITLVKNSEHIKIQFSAFMVDIIKKIADEVSDITITACHNFYPERYTGVPKKEFVKINKVWASNDYVQTAAFISSNVEGAHGPWPVYNGLPTIEDHRDRPIDFQVRELMAMGTDTIYFGNAFASEAELMEASMAVQVDAASGEETEFERMIKVLMPNVGKKKIIFKIDEEANLNEIEKKVLYEFKKHCELGDSSDYMIRSRIPRTIYGKYSIPHRPSKPEYFTRGDILVVNDNLKHYCGELEICLQDMKNDGQRNLVGRLNEDEMQMINWLEPGTYFSFK